MLNWAEVRDNGNTREQKRIHGGVILLQYRQSLCTMAALGFVRTCPLVITSKVRVSKFPGRVSTLKLAMEAFFLGSSGLLVSSSTLALRDSDSARPAVRSGLLWLRRECFGTIFRGPCSEQDSPIMACDKHHEFPQFFWFWYGIFFFLRKASWFGSRLF
jgi:hypothetical protein